MRDSRNCYCAS